MTDRQLHAPNKPASGAEQKRPDSLAEKATKAQNRAAYPASSVFVSANAGTGKTKVLTDRVLRLLLAGEEARSILCMTYTNSAAAEMQIRLNKVLAQWAICSDSDLRDSLIKTGLINPTQDEIARARRLFAEILDSDDGPRIETVHAFCLSVLQRFPIEAGLPPNFEMLEDLERDNLLFESLMQILKTPPITLVSDIELVISKADEQTLLRLLKLIFGERQFIEELISSDLAYANGKTHLEALAGYTTAKALQNEAIGLCDQLAELHLDIISDVLITAGVNQQKRASDIRAYLACAPELRPENLAFLKSAFFTSGAPRKTLSDKKAREIRADIDALQGSVITLLQDYFLKQEAFATARQTQALLNLSRAVYGLFRARKLEIGKIDYDDLILWTARLLGMQQVMDWLRWKLDTSINHVMVDEAQDTSPVQWQLISRLTEPFFEEKAETQENTRTVFAVGDFKQSIYSFQGASPTSFLDQRDRLATEAKAAEADWREEDFTVSFRSSKAVLSFVDAVMAKSDTNLAGLAGSTNEKGELYRPHDVFFAHRAGFVELWPLIKGNTKVDLPAFKPASPEAASESPDWLLAQHVARQIAELLQSGADNPLHRPIHPGEIMILLRKRGSVYYLLRAALIKAGIPVAGADRIKLQNQIEIQDLMALGDACLLPEDDLQLAAVLKSPLFGLDDDDLMTLAINRGQASLFDRLNQHLGASSHLGQAADKLAHWRDLADQLDVQRFYAEILYAEGGRVAMETRLGHQIADTLDVFLAMAGEHKGIGLGDFLRQFRENDSALKRDMDSGDARQVRLMTIHASKGLEAPIVILPDMLNQKMPADPLIFHDNGFYWPSAADFRPETVSENKSEEESQRKAEADRLLYVALTRAREALIIGGWEAPHLRFMKESWYQRLADTLAKMPGVEELAPGHLRLSMGQAEAAVTEPEIKGKDRTQIPVSAAMRPPWFERPAPTQRPDIRPLRPSDLGPLDDIAQHGVASEGQARLRGQLIHQLLDILPNAPKERHAQLLKQFWSGREQQIEANQIAQINAEIETLLALPELAPLFAEEALSEVPLVGMVQNRPVSAQLDRLRILEDQILLADFKTGQIPKNDVPPDDYIRQMALYADLLGQLYPDKAVHTVLVWTRGPLVMPIAREAREAAIKALFS